MIAPPYDVINERRREELEARSPYNVVRIDLPRGNGDPYENAARQLAAWKREDVIVRDSNEAIWLLAQEYTGPDGVSRIRHGVLARVRVEDYGPGRDPSPRANPSGAKGGSPAASACDEGQPLPHLFALRRPEACGL